MRDIISDASRLSAAEGEPTEEPAKVAVSAQPVGADRPLVSIICPTYNCADKLSLTLRSVLTQTGVDFECIVVDGGSNDGTIAVVEAFLPDERLHCDSRRDRGIYDAMNRGIDLARGRFLFFLGAGDRLRPGSLQAIAAEAELHRITSATFVYGDVFWDGRDVVYDGKFSRFKLAARNICHQAIFYHREVFSLLGKFELRYPTHADYAFNIRCFASRQIKKRYAPVIVADYEAGGVSSLCADANFNSECARLVRLYLGIPAAIYHRYLYGGWRDIVAAFCRVAQRKLSRLKSG
jgi:glycosyltransferase involved in cell wall biosynthesis